MQNRLPHTRSSQWMFVEWNDRLNFLNNYRGIEETDVSPCHSCIHFLTFHSVTELLVHRARWCPLTDHIVQLCCGLVTTFGPMECEGTWCTRCLGPAWPLGNGGRSVGSNILQPRNGSHMLRRGGSPSLGACMSSWIRTICTQDHLLHFRHPLKRETNCHLI